MGDLKMFFTIVTSQLRSLNEHRHNVGARVIVADGRSVFQTAAGFRGNRRSNGRRHRSHPLLRLLQGGARVRFYYEFSI